jgi:hypothetical protein
MSLRAYMVKARERGKKRENLESADSREEAEQLVAEYKTAFGPKWDVWFRQRHTKFGEKAEKFILMRNSGQANSAIAAELDMNIFQVNAFARKLTELGFIEKRESGTQPGYEDELVIARRCRMIELAAGGMRYVQIHKEVALGYVAVRAFFQKVKAPLKTARLGDFLTDGQLEKVQQLWRTYDGDKTLFHAAVVQQVIQPNLEQINAKLGQENDARYLAYAIQYALSTGHV